MWQGSVLECGSSSNEILISHSQFTTDSGSCNNNAIVARGVNVIDTGNNTLCFSSQLNITVTSDMRNKTIECIHDHAGGSTRIGASSLVFTTGKNIYNNSTFGILSV